MPSWTSVWPVVMPCIACFFWKPKAVIAKPSSSESGPEREGVCDVTFDGLNQYPIGRLEGRNKAGVGGIFHPSSASL